LFDWIQFAFFVYLHPHHAMQCKLLNSLTVHERQLLQTHRSCLVAFSSTKTRKMDLLSSEKNLTRLAVVIQWLKAYHNNQAICPAVHRRTELFLMWRHLLSDHEINASRCL